MTQDREHESGATWRHGDGWAFNVKTYGRVSGLDDVDAEMAEEIEERAREWWWTDVRDAARELGFSDVFAVGRMGGWLVPEIDGAPVGGFVEGWSDDERMAGPYFTAGAFSREWSGVPLLDDGRSAMLCALGERVRAAMDPAALADLVAMVREFVEEERAEEEAERLERVATLVGQLVAADGDAEQVAALVGPLVR